MTDLINKLKKNKIGDYFEDVNLSKYTTYHVGGKAKLMIFPKNLSKLILLLKILKDGKIKHKIIGNGSNLIFSDDDYDGVIIKLDHFKGLTIDDTTIKVEAGYSLVKLAYLVSRMGLSGLEFATGIPGTVGGAVFMNAGAYKSDMGYVISSVKVLTPDYEIEELFNRDLQFHYRTSFLQKHLDYICLEATIVLKKGDKKEINDLIEERRQKRLMTQPLEFPTAGSVFRNPKDDFAGRLIEECDMKGHRLGGAMVSEKHANFIINYDHATGKDIKDLITLVKEKVKEKFNIELKVEQEFVNWE